MVQARGFDSTIGWCEARKRRGCATSSFRSSRTLTSTSECHSFPFTGGYSPWTGPCHTDVHFCPNINLHRLSVYRYACTNAIDFLDSSNDRSDLYHGSNRQPLWRPPTLSTSPLLWTRAKVGAIAKPDADVDIESLALSLNALSALLSECKPNTLPRYTMTDISLCILE